ncbi:hypothetical protein HDU77_008949 [Chytriomyces hyalinus]|nr:hypothetical protein HDU77_008949 [Chytriomyces hyalinus]
MSDYCHPTHRDHSNEHIDSKASLPPICAIFSSLRSMPDPSFFPITPPISFSEPMKPIQEDFPRNTYHNQLAAPPRFSGREQRLQQRMAHRKQAEKVRRDQMNVCLVEIRQLLPRSVTRFKKLSKEETVHASYEYIVALEEEAVQKAELVRQLEAEVVAETLLALQQT